MTSLADISIPDYLLPIAKLQEWISDIKADDVNRITVKIAENDFFHKDAGIDIIVNEFIRFTRLRSGILSILARICTNLSALKEFSSLKQKMLKAHLKVNNFHFLRQCFDCGMFNIKDITDTIHKYNQYSRDDIFLLFATFAPEIQSYDSKLAFDFWIRITSQNSCAGLHFVLFHLSDYMKDDAKRLKELLSYGIEKDTIAYALKFDDFDLFSSFTLTPCISIHDEVIPNRFEPIDIVECSHFIEFAAFFGSVTCFKYLYLNNAKSNNISHYALAGGNFEIIHILKLSKTQIENGFLTTISFFRNDIFDWLIGMIPLSQENIRLCMHEAIQCNNIKAILLLTKLTLNINEQDVNQKTILHYAAGIGCGPVIEYLLSIEADPNITDKHGHNPHEYAKNEEIANIILQK